LRILQICSASQMVYGAAHGLMTLAKAQRASGKHVEFVTFKGKKFGEQVRRDGFKVHEVRVRAKIDPVAIFQMRRIIKDGGFDLVHTHLSTSSVNGCLAARVAKTPSVATVHGMSGKLSFSAAHHLIGVSEQVKAHLVGQGVPSEKVSVVYNGFEPQPETPKSTARRMLEIPADATVIGTVARVTALKGIDDALKAFAGLLATFPNLVYLVVGDGDALPSCKALAADLGIADKVIFAGYQSDVSLYLSAMDLFLFPSLKEAMGIALVEAMAVGLPTVATNVGGIPEVLSSDCGLMVEPRSPEALASATARMLSETGLAQKIGAAARYRANEVFSPIAMERSTDWVYRDLLGLGLPVPAEQTPSLRQHA
jgi:glycosyltransferase involved in cell wall biosynthesis